MEISAASCKVQGVIDIIERLKHPDDDLGWEVKKIVHLRERDLMSR